MAIRCLEHRGEELLEQVYLFSLPAESFGGGRDSRDYLLGRVRQWLDAKPAGRLEDMVSPEEWEAIQEIEAEMIASNPWIGDADRLDKVHSLAGTMPVGARLPTDPVLATLANLKRLEGEG